ncbi:MAG: glycosyl hydrolase [Polyangia bacterium]
MNKKILSLTLATSLAALVGCSDSGTSGSGTNTSPSGSGGSTMTGSTAGTTTIASATGGTTRTGGSTPVGTSTRTGGSTSVGTSTPTGGSTSVGTSTPTGGSTSVGTSTPTGGSTSVGTSTPTGGSTPRGGTTSEGGSTPTGGTTATGGTTPTGGASPCDVLPVSPNASTQAKNLLCYLYSEYGTHVLSGQQEANWNANPTDISWYNTNIGKYPAILGSDFLYRDGDSCTAVTSSTTRGIAYWNAGGLTMFRYHMGQPVAGSTCANDCYDGTNCAESTPAAGFFTNVITAGTGENTAFLNRLDYVAAQIGAMQTANVPIILALFHETQQNGWFWWSIGDTGAQFVALWTYAFNYLTKTKGLTNIIWLMPFSGSPSAAFYPGKQYVDVSGGDTYGTNQPFTSLYSTCKGIMGSTIPIALHETGLIPTPSAMFPTAAPWILFNIWAGYETSNNTVANIKSVYSDAHTITRDLIPSLK